MAVQTITYEDKQYLNENADIPATNKVQDTDMNEIKSVVNNNANELINLTPVVLYENASGTISNIILNDDISNYSYYEIYYARNGNGYASMRMSTDFLSNVSLITSFFSGTILRYYMTNITISGTNLTRNYTKYVNFTGANALDFGDDGSFYIYKIIAYK